MLATVKRASGVRLTASLRRGFRILPKDKGDAEEPHREKRLEKKIADEMPPAPCYSYQKEPAAKSKDGSLRQQMPEGGKWRSPDFADEASGYYPESRDMSNSEVAFKKMDEEK
ncbi:hypothetical protein HDU67_004226 [Dinochytrium kinnereticum]|nr:hypothetical protein HDU67_004226 [Dinochytrium kinnereticum]